MFDTNGNTKTSPATAANAGIPANKKAAGFLNLYLPARGNSGRRKLGAIPLRANTKNEAELSAWLKEDPSRVSQILAVLQIEFNPVDDSIDTGFDLTPKTGATAPAEQPAT